jgi:hypothetical protein
MPLSHKKQKLLQSSAIINEQSEQRKMKRKAAPTKAPRKAQTTIPKKAAPVDFPPIINVEDSPQDLGLPTPGIDPQARSTKMNRHVRKVRATWTFVLDNTILHSSVCQSSVDSFKNQKKSTAISPDNLKKSAIYHFPSTISYSSNVVTAPGKSRRLAERKQQVQGATS